MSAPASETSSRVPTGPLPSGLTPLARLASRVYAAGVARRNRRFDAGRGVERVPVPVVSIGNVSVGGTGKTPFVRRAVEELRALGARPAIAMRGYARERGGRSDEELEYEALVPDVPLIVDPDRVGAVRAALGSGATFDVVVLDDGFQHRRLARDLDVVLVDAARPAIDGDLLPAGWLREPPGALARADLVALTRCDHPDAPRAATLVEAVIGREPDVRARHAWSSIDRVHPMRGVVERLPDDALRGRRVAILAAIGNPTPFVEQVSAAGATIVDRRVLRDHARFDAAALDWIATRARGGDAIVCTMKDWVKLGPALAARDSDDGATILVPRLEVRIETGAAALRAALARALAAGDPADG